MRITLYTGRTKYYKLLRRLVVSSSIPPVWQEWEILTLMDAILKSAESARCERCDHSGCACVLSGNELKGIDPHYILINQGNDSLWHRRPLYKPPSTLYHIVFEPKEYPLCRFDSQGNPRTHEARNNVDSVNRLVGSLFVHQPWTEVQSDKNRYQ